jgi:hypothetical protein
MNIQSIATLTRNEIWNHINEFQLPVKKYPSTVAARAALVAYYEQLPEETVGVVAEPVSTSPLVALEETLAEPVMASSIHEDSAITTSPSGATVAVVLLTLAGAFLRVLAIYLIVAVIFATRAAAGLPAALQKLRAAAPRPELRPASQVGLA